MFANAHFASNGNGCFAFLDAGQKQTLTNRKRDHNKEGNDSKQTKQQINKKYEKNLEFPGIFAKFSETAFFEDMCTGTFFFVPKK